MMVTASTLIARAVIPIRMANTLRRRSSMMARIIGRFQLASAGGVKIPHLPLHYRALALSIASMKSSQDVQVRFFCVGRVGNGVL
jgi:hypothetical protein